MPRASHFTECEVENIQFLMNWPGAVWPPARGIMGFVGHIANHIVLQGRLFTRAGPQPLAKNLVQRGRDVPRRGPTERGGIGLVGRQ